GRTGPSAQAKISAWRPSPRSCRSGRDGSVVGEGVCRERVVGAVVEASGERTQLFGEAVAVARCCVVLVAAGQNAGRPCPAVATGDVSAVRAFGVGDLGMNPGRGRHDGSEGEPERDEPGSDTAGPNHDDLCSSRSPTTDVARYPPWPRLSCM